MPRKSAAELTILIPRVDGRPNHITAPPGLGAEERRLFAGLVRSMPAEHFRQGDVPLLVRHIEAILMTERAGREMESTGGPVIAGADGLVTNPWFGVQQRSARMVAVLATRLRMSPQSRRDPKVVARAGARQPSYYDQMDAADD